MVFGTLRIRLRDSKLGLWSQVLLFQQGFCHVFFRFLVLGDGIQAQSAGDGDHRFHTHELPLC